MEEAALPPCGTSYPKPFSKFPSVRPSHTAQSSSKTLFIVIGETKLFLCHSPFPSLQILLHHEHLAIIRVVVHYVHIGGPFPLKTDSLADASTTIAGGVFHPSPHNLPPIKHCTSFAIP